MAQAKQLSAKVKADRREISRILGLMHLQQDFREAVQEYVTGGAVDAGGNVPFIVVSPDDLVFDAMAMPDPALTEVVFATFAEQFEDTIQFVLMTRRSVEVLPEDAMGLGFGMTVREWLRLVDARAASGGYHAEYVPDTAPSGWVVQSAQNLASHA